jgi:hypothetical protein
MSIFCNLGKPSKDLAFQNVDVNQSVRVNKLLKVTRAEFDRLCAIKDTKAHLFAGSVEFFGDNVSPPVLPFGFTMYALPSGTLNIGNDITEYTDPNIALTLYTDTELVVGKFQMSLYPELLPEISPPVQIDGCLSVGPTPTLLTNLVTLNFTNVSSGSIVRETFTGDSVVIPAKSYYSILIRQSNGNVANDINRLQASWTLTLS